MKAPRRPAFHPIQTLAQLTDTLGLASSGEFPRQWLRRTCSAELARLTIEDAYADRDSDPYGAAEAALEALLETDDWVSPKLSKFLAACHAIGVAPELERTEVETAIDVAGERLCLLEWQPRTDVPMTVSNAYAGAVQVIERSLAHPQYCKALIRAFAGRVRHLQSQHGATGLLFIEKEAGPVGAITMMASLVAETGLPATVYRETRWAQSNALTGNIPGATDRLIVVYDLIVTGTGVVHAAGKVRAATGANCVGAVVLRGHGERRNELEAEGGPIVVEALSWDDRQIAETAAGVVDGVSERAELVRSSPTPLKESPMNDAVPGRIPPGAYSRETLPEIGDGARRILERIRLRTRAPSGAQDPIPDIVRRKPSEPVAGLRPSESLAPSLRPTPGDPQGRMRRMP